MRDMYFIDCSKCESHTVATLDNPPIDDEKVVCDNCRLTEDEDFIGF